MIEFDHEVSIGSSGAKVLALQDRLRELAFDPGPSDGFFGPATARAVWAYEKFLEGVPSEEAIGVVGPERWQRMNGTFDIRPRRANPGTHVEVLLPSQVAVVYRADRPILITHVSSGTGEEWCSVVTVDGTTITVQPRGDVGPGALNLALFEAGIAADRVQRLTRSLEDVFLDLTADANQTGDPNPTNQPNPTPEVSR